MALPRLQRKASHTQTRAPRTCQRRPAVQHPGTGAGRYLSPLCQREVSASLGQSLGVCVHEIRLSRRAQVTCAAVQAVDGHGIGIIDL